MVCRYVRATWGKGVATEVVSRVLDHGFRAFSFDPIVAVTHPENTGSQKVLAKTGLKFRGLHPHNGLDPSFFSLSRDAYLTFQ